MRKLLLTLLFSALTLLSYSQIIYTDNYGAVYPNTSTINEPSIYLIDLNGDTEMDIRVRYQDLGITRCTITGWNNAIGQNKVSKIDFSGSDLLMDCTDSIIDYSLPWTNTAWVFEDCPNSNDCESVGIGEHMFAFRLIEENPLNNQLGFKYGYVEYTLTPDGTIIIYGWYYEDSFNMPITANPLTVSILENSEKNNLIYPNPAENYINITKGQEYRIIDTMGKTITKGKSDGKIDVSNLQGIYYVLIDKTHQKIIVL